MQAPHGICHLCNLFGCKKSVAVDAQTGRVHEFCCKEHAQRAIDNGEWTRPQREQVTKRSGGEAGCKLAGCSLPVFSDASGRSFDFCGRTHAVEHRQQLQQKQSQQSSRPIAANAQPVGPRVFKMPPYSAYAPPPLPAASAAAPLKSAIKTSSSSSSVPPFSLAAPASVPTPASQAAASEASSSGSICVVCLTKTAAVVLIPCGHICLCELHADEMEAKGMLVTCPCCKVKVSSRNKVYFNG